MTICGLTLKKLAYRNLKRIKATIPALPDGCTNLFHRFRKNADIPDKIIMPTSRHVSIGHKFTGPWWWISAPLGPRKPYILRNSSDTP